MPDQIEPAAWMDEFGELFGAGQKPYINPKPLYDEDAREASYRVGFEDGEKHAAEALADAQSQASTYRRILDELTAKQITGAVADVVKERRRQVDVEDFTSTYDDMTTRSQLASAGACYALTASGTPTAVIEKLWPWAPKWWKPTTVRRNLVKAAALLIAEIERIDRADARTTSGGDHGR